MGSKGQQRRFLLFLTFLERSSEMLDFYEGSIFKLSVRQNLG